MTKRLAVLAVLAFTPALLHAQADEQLRQAISRYENNEIERARALFAEVTSSTTPFSVTEAQRVIAYKYLGAILTNLGRRDTAITFFLAAIERDPLVDLDRAKFVENERQVFQEARGRIFRLGMRPIVRDTLDPRSERTNFTIASTHNGLVRVELVSTSDEARYTLFEGDVNGPRDIPFNGLSPRGGGLIPRGTYDLVATGQSRTNALQSDSTSRLIEISWDRAALEDTLAAFGPNDILATRHPPSVARRDLLLGVGIAAGAIISANLVGQSELEGRTALASGVAALSVGSGLYAFLHRRNHPEIPENIVENAARQQRRATANARIMQRNGVRIDATKIIVRPLGQ